MSKEEELGTFEGMIPKKKKKSELDKNLKRIKLSLTLPNHSFDYCNHLVKEIHKLNNVKDYSRTNFFSEAIVLMAEKYKIDVPESITDVVNALNEPIKSKF